MSEKTLTRADLCEAVYQKVGLSRTESAELVETVLDTICDKIVQGRVSQAVFIRNLFGAPEK